MTARPNALQAVLDRTAAPKPKEPERKPVPPSPPKAAKTYREGRKLVSAHVPANVHRQLRLLAVDEDTDQQHLIEEALQLLFIKKGRGPVVSN